MLYVKSMEIENFMRIKNADVVFPESGIFGILAQGHKNKRRSNFLGKSTITKAVRYALTGSYDGNKETDLIHNDEKLMKVKLILSDGTKDYSITRGRDYKNKGLVELDWIDKTTEAKNAITNLIGLDKDDFDLTSFFKQEEINSFMLLSNTEKKKRVMRWQKNDHWSDKEKRVLEDIRQQNEEISNLKFQISNNKLGLSGVNSIEEMQMELSDSKENLVKLKDKYTKAKEKYETLSANIKNLEDNLSDLQDSFESKTDKLKTVKDKIIRLKKELSYYDDLDTIKQDSQDLEEQINAVDIEKIKSKKTEKDYKISEIKNRITTLKKYNQGICPIISEPCDRLELTPKQEKQMLDEIELLQEQSTQLHKTILKNKDLIERLNENKKNLNKVELYQSKLTPLQEQFKELDKETKGIRLKLGQLKNINKDDYEETKNKYQSLSDLVKEQSAKIKVIEYKIEQAEEKLKENEELEERLLIELGILDNRKYLAYMFGRNGIPSLEIENSFQIVEDEINTILKELDATLAVIFKPYRELSTYETHCVSCGWAFPKGYRKKECEQCNEERRKKRSDEIILNVIEKGNERPFSVCSGGLKTLVSTAVRTALAMLLKRSGSCNLNILFLDEIDSALDQEFKEKIKDLVVNVLHKKLGFNQIFWISHDKGIIDQIPKILMVKGYENYSKVDWL